MADASGVTALLAKTSLDQLIEVSFSGKGLKLNSAEDAREVVTAIQACEGMQSLKLNGNTIGVEAAQALAKSLESKPEFQRARWSDMFTGRLRSDIPPALESLGAGIMMAGAHLVELDLSDNAFGPHGVKAVRKLLESSSCYTLREMRFNNNGLGIGGKLMAEALITCHKKSSKAGKPLALKVFIAGRNRLENPGATALAKAFKIIGTLEEIAMPQNGINHEGITALAEAVEYNRNLKILNLNDNTFTARGAIPMAKAIKNLSKLEVINFRDCLVRSEGADAIADSLREGVPSLKELNLSFGEIKKEAAVRVAESMDTKPHLTLLDLNGNGIGEEGIMLIRMVMDANNHADALGTLSNDEGSEDEEDDVEEEKRGQESKDPHLQVKGTAISPRREVTKNKIPVTAADFLANPTAKTLLALGNQREKKILQELENAACEAADELERQYAINNPHVKNFLQVLSIEDMEEIALWKMFIKISSVMDSENNDVKDAVYQCTDFILNELFSSEKYTPESMDGWVLLFSMKQFKGDGKLSSASVMLLTLEHAVTQEYDNGASAQFCDRMMIVLSSINSSTPTQSYLKLCTINVCSIRRDGRLQSVFDLVSGSMVDFTAITETRLKQNDPLIHVPGHRFVHRPRTDRPTGSRGGGTALLFKETFYVHQVDASETSSFEYACYRIRFGSVQFELINIYRPPYSKEHPVVMSVFFSEFKRFLQNRLSCDIPVIITGDFNIKVDIDNSDTRSFMALLDSFSYTQHVDFPTHTGGHTLDLVISRKSDNIIVGRTWRGPLVSDHYAVMYLLNPAKAPVPQARIQDILGGEAQI